MYNEIWTQELSILKTLSTSINIFLKRLMSILAVILMINIPVRMLDLLMSTYVFDNRKHFFLYTGLGILESFVTLLSTIAITLIVDSEINNNEGKLSLIFKKTWPAWGGAILTTILQGLIIIPLFLLIIIPGVIWTIYYTFIVQVVVLKKITGKKALDYSKFLVRGRWWKIFTIFLIYAAIHYLIFRLANLPQITFGSINELRVLLIPLSEILNSFLVVITCALFANFDYLYGIDDASKIEKHMAIDYFISKTNVKIDDSEAEFECNEEVEELRCTECGIKLIESDEICPACRKEKPKL